MPAVTAAGRDRPDDGAPTSRRPPTPEELAWADGHRTGTLGTVNADGTAALVPVCFALVEDARGPAIVTPLDEKPKREDVLRLARVRNVVRTGRATMALDDYTEAWSRLAWLSLRGSARLAEPGEPLHAAAVEALRAKYPRYRDMAIDRNPVIAIGDLSAQAWSGAGLDDPAPFPRAGREGLETLLRTRRSVRAFRPDPVPRETVMAAIEAAGWAPSPHGRQPWRFAVVESPERRRALADAMAATWDSQLRLDGQALPEFRYRDYGSLISLSRFSAVGNLMGNLMGSVKLEGWLARMFYISLYRMHQMALYGLPRTALLMLADRLGRSTEPRLKLH